MTRDEGTATPTELGEAARERVGEGETEWLFVCGEPAELRERSYGVGFRPLGFLARGIAAAYSALCGIGDWGLAHGAGGVTTWCTIGITGGCARPRAGQTHALGHASGEKRDILGAAMPKAVVFKLSTPSAHLHCADLLLWGLGTDPTGSAA